MLERMEGTNSVSTVASAAEMEGVPLPGLGPDSLRPHDPTGEGAEGDREARRSGGDSSGKGWACSMYPRFILSPGTTLGTTAIISQPPLPQISQEGSTTMTPCDRGATGAQNRKLAASHPLSRWWGHLSLTRGVCR